MKQSTNMSHHTRKILISPLAIPHRLNFIIAACLFFWCTPALAGPPRLIPICSIQGNGFSSPYQGRTVRTQGVVTMDLDQASQRGFFLQAANCDNLPSTSDGIFVFLGERLDVVAAGDQMEVTGTVDEYFGQTELQVAPANVKLLSHGNPLPAMVELNPPFSNEPAQIYFESLEGMYVGLSQGLVVGPTDAEDQTWLVNANLGVERVFYGDPRGTGEVICSGDDGLFKVNPQAKAGDSVQNLVGVLDFRYGLYCIEPAVAPVGRASLHQTGFDGFFWFRPPGFQPGHFQPGRDVRHAGRPAHRRFAYIARRIPTPLTQARPGDRARNRASSHPGGTRSGEFDCFTGFNRSPGDASFLRNHLAGRDRPARLGCRAALPPGPGEHSQLPDPVKAAPPYKMVWSRTGMMMW